MPPLAIGDIFQGGAVFERTQFNPNTNTGTVTAKILYPTKVTTLRTGVTNPVTWAEANGAFTQNTGGYSNWRIMTEPEALAIWNAKNNGLLGAVTTLQTNRYNWTSTRVLFSIPGSNYVVRFNTGGGNTYLNNRDERGISLSNSEEAEYWPVRTYSKDTL
jgi:predicted permease